MIFRKKSRWFKNRPMFGGLGHMEDKTWKIGIGWYNHWAGENKKQEIIR